MNKFLMNSSGQGIAAPLDASYYKGTGLRQGIEREFVLLEQDTQMPECQAVYSHPMASTIYLAGEISPTITVKLAKLSSDGPLVLIRKKP